MGELTRRLGLAVLAVATAVAPAAATPALRNGSFADGHGMMPAAWRTEAWAADKSRFAWEHEADGIAVVTITSPEPNDARWCQTVAVEPGAAYRVRARVRTAGVGADTAGALIAIEPRVADSPDVRGTQPWQTIEVVAEAGDHATWDVCLRLGSYANLNTGTAWFTGVEIAETRPAPARWRARALAHLRPVIPEGVGPASAPLAGGILLAWGLGIFRRRR